MDEVLDAGSGANRGNIVRRGDTVHRPAGPHTAAVHAFLRHLRNPVERLHSFCDAYQLDSGRTDRLLDAVDHYLRRGRLGVRRRVEAGEAAFVAYWEAGLGDRLLRAAEWLRSNREALSNRGS